MELAVNGSEFWLKHALGTFYSNGTTPTDTTGVTRDAGGGIAAAAGAVTIAVNAAVVGAVAPNDFVRIGTIASKDTFVRKVVSEITTGGSETITVDIPIPRQVLAAEPVYTVVSPYTHVYTRGVLPTSFSIQHNFEDITQFFKYSGLRINSFGITIPRTGLVTVSMDVRGKTSVRAGTATGGALSGVEVLPYVSWEGAVEEGGGAFGEMLETTINIENDLDDSIFAIGDRERISLPEGRGSVTGSASFLFSDATIADKFRAETDSSIEVAFVNGANSATFLMPKVKYTGGAGDPSFANAFGPVILENFPFQAVYDSVEGTDLKVTLVSTEYLV